MADFRFLLYDVHDDRSNPPAQTTRRHKQLFQNHLKHTSVAGHEIKESPEAEDVSRARTNQGFKLAFI